MVTQASVTASVTATKIKEERNSAYLILLLLRTLEELAIVYRFLEILLELNGLLRPCKFDSLKYFGTYVLTSLLRLFISVSAFYVLDGFFNWFSLLVPS